MIRLFLIISLLILPLISQSQQGILSLTKNGLDYKKAMKLAQESQKPIVAILYSPFVRTTTIPRAIQNVARTITEAGCIGIAIDWAKAPLEHPQKKIRQALNTTYSPFSGNIAMSNPLWVFIHHNGLLVNVSSTITDEDSLNKFILASRSTYEKIEALGKKALNSNKLSDQLEYLRALAGTYDYEKATEELDDFIKGINKRNISDDALQQIFSLGYHIPYSKKLNKLISSDYEKAKMVAGRDTILSIQKAYILQELSKKDKLAPFHVWKRYEKELGDGADSLYRRFALSYLSTPPFDPKALYDEAIDYIHFYPKSDWDYLKPLYALVVPRTTKKDDLELLLDLISFQILREESYEQLDYKAVLLYKIGKKERALRMIKQINASAVEKGIRYKSMLYTLSKN